MKRGQYDRVGKPHPHKGWTVSEESKKRYSMAKMGEKNPNWKGDKIQNVTALHTWIEDIYLCL